jgi:hypothetical protein
MKVGFVVWSVGPLRWDRIKGPKIIEERSAKRSGPRCRIDGVGDGVANPSKSGESLLNIGHQLGRAEGDARLFKSFEVLVLGALDG